MENVCLLKTILTMKGGENNILGPEIFIFLPKVYGYSRV